jgi:hypothetical protein
MNTLNQKVIAHLEPIVMNNLLAAARRARRAFVQVYPTRPPTEYRLHPASATGAPQLIDDLPVKLDPNTRPGYVRVVAPEG